MKYFPLLLCCVLWVCAACQNKIKVRPITEPESTISLPFEEPSGLALSSDQQHLWVVTDEGLIAKITLTGELVLSQKYSDRDWEAVAVHDGNVYAVDEQQCRIYVFDEHTLDEVSEHDYGHPGPSSIGYEGIAFDDSGQLIVAHERNPVELHFIHAKSMNKHKDMRIVGFSDLSGLTWQQGRLWMLSDEDQRIIRMEADLTGAERTWRIRAKQPEGLAFLPDGRAAVVAEGCNCLLLYSL